MINFPPMEENVGATVILPDMDPSLDAIRDQMVQLLPRLRRYAIALTGSVADGDDLVQDAVERALRNLHHWEPGTRLDSWMFRIAKNRFIDTRRSLKRGNTVTIDTAEDVAALDGERAMQTHLAFQDTAKALQDLPVEQRQALALVLGEG